MSTNVLKDGFSLSVFMPAFNEEANIEKTVKKTLEVLQGLSLKDYELLVIDDGSKDRTGEIVKNLQKKDKHIKLITHSPNKGYGEALKSGFYNAKFEWIAFTDSDGQLDFSEINKFLEKASGADLVVGYRINRQDPPLRKLNGWGWTLLSNTLLGIGVRDVDCAFKLVRKKVIDTIPRLESTRGGMISPELLAKAKKSGFKIVEVGVHHYSREAGVQTGANLRVIIQSFKDLFKLWWKIK
jgi:glycosyltransferase involved in cell wall biosynthesis